ncbi:unnamed protein product [Sphagnum jensenii]|uniref:F-box domain-containing protein n=1 Tax=Sphagnum jensenii TaxID=128206 RepID=A0ABP1BRS4_9BRYO
MVSSICCRRGQDHERGRAAKREDEEEEDQVEDEEQQKEEEGTSIWGGLPDQLVERVLAFLPLKDVIRMRCVCKKWCEDTRSTSFAKLHAMFSCSSSREQQQKPWFIVCTGKRRFLSYDVNSCSWKLLSVSCLPDPDLQVLASSRGLLCYGFRWGELTSTDLYVCNPVTKKWEHLPPHPEQMVDHFGMAYDETTSAYKILTMNAAASSSVGGGAFSSSVGGSNSIRDVRVYNSRTKKWTPGVLPKPSMHFGKSPMVFCNGWFFLMDRMRPFCELFAYNIEQCVWKELQTVSPRYFEYPSLVECGGGRLFMIGIVKDCHRIWEVVINNQEKEQEDCREMMKLVLYETLPSQFPNEFKVRRVSSLVGAGRCPNYNPFRLNAIGSSNNLICFTSNIDYSWVLVYNTELRTFHWSSKDPIHPSLSDYAGVSFQPCLAASP